MWKRFSSIGSRPRLVETDFAGHSYGFRPGRGARDAPRRVDTLLKAGHAWVVDADLKSYFDTIPHERLLALVKERVGDGRVLALVESFLRAGVLEENQGWQPTERGTPQGGVISPLLANLYLNPLDQQMETAGWAMVRYADDFVIPCRNESEAQNALAAVRQWVSEAGLTLHPEKTRVVDASVPGGFDFLGYHFERGMKMAAEEEPDEIERPGARADLATGRSEPDGNRDRREPEFARLASVLPAQQSEHVCGGGRLREATVEERTAMAVGWAGQRHRSNPSTLAE